MFNPWNFDACSGFAVMVVSLIVGHVAVSENDRLRRLGAALGGVCFLACFFGNLVQKHHPFDFFCKCLALGGAAVGMTWIVAATISWLLELLIFAPMRVRREAQAERWSFERQADQNQRYAREQAELLQHQRAMREAQLQGERLRNTPPAPKTALTRQERFAAAKRKYEDMLNALHAAGLSDDELAAASAKARQQYLTELDQGME